MYSGRRACDGVGRRASSRPTGPRIREHSSVNETPTVSVIVPVYNEEAVLPLTAHRLRQVMDGLAEPYEVILVNDGSADRSNEVIRQLQQNWPQLRLIELQRNSGHQAALTAGLQRAFGRYVVSIDADLQDPPETIPEMLRLARTDGLDVVYGVRNDRSTDTFFKRQTAGLYYRLMRRAVGSWVPAQAGDFRLLSSDAVNALMQLPEQKPVYRLVVPALGFRSGEVTYVRAERAAGETKYPLRKMIALAVEAHRPLLCGAAAARDLARARGIRRLHGPSDLQRGRLRGRLDRAGLDVDLRCGALHRRGPTDLYRTPRRVRRAHLRPPVAAAGVPGRIRLRRAATAAAGARRAGRGSGSAGGSGILGLTRIRRSWWADPQVVVGCSSGRGGLIRRLSSADPQVVVGGLVSIAWWDRL